MAASAEYYQHLVEAFSDTESLTVLVVAGSSPETVAGVLDVDLTAPIGRDGAWDEEGTTAWALLDVPGGVLAVEPTGFGDPTCAALQRLSVGGAAAVVRHNVLAHLRFGCARDGELLFDDNEYMFVEDPDVVPTELRPLFDLVWTDLEDEDEDEDEFNGFDVGLAMGEQVTGIRLTADHVAELDRSEYFRAPSQVYVASLDD
ncbi:hypothetical protein ASG90_06665 [Nocardioides sp. Soil797]|nr:hypothetical protein ASG90_06665 [Nocardioides sp. Soil797]